MLMLNDDDLVALTAAGVDAAAGVALVDNSEDTEEGVPQKLSMLSPSASHDSVKDEEDDDVMFDASAFFLRLGADTPPLNSDFADEFIGVEFSDPAPECVDNETETTSDKALESLMLSTSAMTLHTTDSPHFPSADFKSPRQMSSSTCMSTVTPTMASPTTGMVPAAERDTSEGEIVRRKMKETGIGFLEDETTRMEVFVANIDYTTTEEQLVRLFSRCGEVTDVTLPLNPGGKTIRGIGFVTFGEESSVARAIEMMDGEKVNGRKIQVRRNKGKVPLAVKQSMQRRRVHQQAYFPLSRSGRRPPLDSNTAFVGNLPFSTTSDELLDLVETTCGVPVHACRIVLNDRKCSRGFGYVDLFDADSVAVVLDKLNGLLYEGRVIRADYASGFIDANCGSEFGTQQSDDHLSDAGAALRQLARGGPFGSHPTPASRRTLMVGPSLMAGTGAMAAPMLPPMPEAMPTSISSTVAMQRGYYVKPATAMFPNPTMQIAPMQMSPMQISPMQMPRMQQMSPLVCGRGMALGYGTGLGHGLGYAGGGGVSVPMAMGTSFGFGGVGLGSVSSAPTYPMASSPMPFGYGGAMVQIPALGSVGIGMGGVNPMDLMRRALTPAPLSVSNMELFAAQLASSPMATTTMATTTMATTTPSVARPSPAPSMLTPLADALVGAGIAATKPIATVVVRSSANAPLTAAGVGVATGQLQQPVQRLCDSTMIAAAMPASSGSAMTAAMPCQFATVHLRGQASATAVPVAANAGGVAQVTVAPVWSAAHGWVYPGLAQAQATAVRAAPM